ARVVQRHVEQPLPVTAYPDVQVEATLPVSTELLGLAVDLPRAMQQLVGCDLRPLARVAARASPVGKQPAPFQPKFQLNLFVVSDPVPAHRSLPPCGLFAACLSARKRS